MLLASTALQATELQWQRLADMPLAVQEIYPAAHNGHIYVAGGLSDSITTAEQQMTAAVQIYHPATDSWRLGPTLPEPRHHAYLVSLQQKLFLFGGFIAANSGRWSASADVLLLDEKLGQWRKVATMPAPLTETVAVVLAGQVHFASGRSPSGLANAQWQDQQDVSWHWVFSPDSYQFTQAAELPLALNSASGVAHDGQLYLLGGRQVGAGNLADMRRFNNTTKQWQTLNAMPQAQGGLAAAVLDNRILVFGGEYFSDGGGVYAEVWQYLPLADSWQQQGKMNHPRHGLGAVALGDAVYVIGGATKAGLNHTSAILERVSLRQAE